MISKSPLFVGLSEAAKMAKPHTLPNYKLPITNYKPQTADDRLGDNVQYTHSRPASAKIRRFSGGVSKKWSEAEQM